MKPALPGMMLPDEAPAAPVEVELGLVVELEPPRLPPLLVDEPPLVPESLVPEPPPLLPVPASSPTSDVPMV